MTTKLQTQQAELRWLLLTQIDTRACLSSRRARHWEEVTTAVSLAYEVQAHLPGGFMTATPSLGSCASPLQDI